MAIRPRKTARKLLVLLAAIFLIACAEELWSKFLPNFLRALGASVASHWWVVLLALPLVMAWQSFSLPATFSMIGDSLPQGARSMAFAYFMGLREIGEPPRKAMIVDLARKDRRSVDVGTYYLFRGLAVFSASLVGGVLWAQSPQLTFLGAACVAAVGMIIFAVMARRFQPDALTEIHVESAPPK